MAKWTYSKAGVDIEKQKEMETNILRKVAPKAVGIGGYSSTLKLGDEEITLHVDGVGTKTLLLMKLGREEVAGWDCVMVNANDVACEGFKVVAAVDYLAIDKPNEELASKIGSGLNDALSELSAYLAGGETAIMPDLVKGFDISCTVLGVREAKPRAPKEGDYVVALASSGPHANGYTLIRKLIDAGVIDLEKLAPWLAAPVVNYHNFTIEGMKEGLIKWAAHVTGGAFEKVHKRMPEGLGIEYDCWDPPLVFKEIVERADMDPHEAYTTFNMGIGMIVITTEPDAVVEMANKFKIRAWIAGRVVKGNSKICTPWGTVEIG